MKIAELKVSNILCFAYKDNIEDATSIDFEDGLNILIGENGSGKSTTLEIINFIFKKVIFKQCDFKENIYENKLLKQASEIKSILSFVNNNNSNDFTLNKNWKSKDKEQKIQIKIELEEIDKNNIKIIDNNYESIKDIAIKYLDAPLGDNPNENINDRIDIIIVLKDNNTFEIENLEKLQKTKEYLYLEKFNLLKQLIRIHNLENENKIDELKDTFVMLGAYRNYEKFDLNINAGTSISQQKQNIENQKFNKSINSIEDKEPAIFKYVMFMIAQKHRDLTDEKGNIESFTKINNEDNFVKKINGKLKLINLKIGLDYSNEHSKDQYTFKFIDLKNDNRKIDIKNLSAGQKAIMHLVFESYGRSDLRGGVVIIDEPEIHLHYQFQHEYIKILNEIKKEQQCQYILVTHSEALINSKTIEFVKRFYLDENRNSTVISPEVKSTEDKNLIKILDNYRSTHAFFCNKVLLVEGETDKYFFQEYINSKYPGRINEIAILDVKGKGQYKKWKEFFEKFKINVYFIGDFDNVTDFDILTKAKIDTVKENIKKSFSENIKKEIKKREKPKDVSSFIKLVLEYFEKEDEGDEKKEEIKQQLEYLKSRYVSYKEIIEELKKKETIWNNTKKEVEEKYKEGIYILQEGDLEVYLNTAKGLDNVIEFCNDKLESFKNNEIKKIFNNILDINAR